MTLEEKAVKAFGITDLFYGAFYMLPDGRLLDGSECNDGGTEGKRSIDHRSICRIYNSLPQRGRSSYWSDESWAMRCFMKRGNIRIMPECGYAELIRKPNRTQLSKLLQLVKEGEITEVEVCREPKNDESATLTDIVSVGQVLSFLREQFKED